VFLFHRGIPEKKENERTREKIREEDLVFPVEEEERAREASEYGYFCRTSPPKLNEKAIPAQIYIYISRKNTAYICPQQKTISW
jgi:hypothetical protein